jgi:pimeloyl-ACP methyl ester carboxylesterase
MNIINYLIQKPIKSVFIILLIFAWFNSVISQDEILYGSNNGKYVSIFNTTVYYEEYGQGIPLLLLHGGGTPMYKFKKVIPKLSNHFRVIAIDSPGWGRSEHPDSLSYQLLADYYSEMIDLLNLDSVYVFGYSDGGNTAFLLAYDRPDKIKRIVVSGANSNTNGYTQKMFDIIESFDPENLEVNETEWLEKYKSKLLQPNAWKKSVTDKQKMWLKKVVISDKKLEKIQCRTLIMLGDRDLCKLEHGIHIYRKIESSELCILPDTPHSTITAKPELVNEIVIDFLTKK